MSWGNKTITYDANGSMLTKGGTTYSWGANRRLVTVSNGNAITYAYDHNGLRTRKYVNETLTEYRWAGSLLLSEKTGTDTICYFYDSTGMLVGMTLNNTLYLYIRNLQGDVIGITDRNGNVVVQYSYDSWGNTISTTGSMAATLGAKNPFRYRGYYYDAETGMYYLQRRYYDPELRKFISADDFNVLCLDQNSFANFNLYNYCLNSPITLSDDTGYFSIPNWAKVVVGVGTIAGLAVATALTGGAGGVVLAAALCGSVVGGTIGVGVGAMTNGVDGAANGFAYGTVAGGLIGGGLAGGNIASGTLKIIGTAQKTHTIGHSFFQNFSLAEWLLK